MTKANNPVATRRSTRHTTQTPAGEKYHNERAQQQLKNKLTAEKKIRYRKLNKDVDDLSDIFGKAHLGKRDKRDKRDSDDDDGLSDIFGKAHLGGRERLSTASMTRRRRMQHNTSRQPAHSGRKRTRRKRTGRKRTGRKRTGRKRTGSRK